jgi:hypothetical protein
MYLIQANPEANPEANIIILEKKCGYRILLQSI